MYKDIATVIKFAENDAFVASEWTGETYETPKKVKRDLQKMGNIVGKVFGKRK